MSIKLATNCDRRIYNRVCKHKGNAANDMNKLRNMTYGEGPNDDYSWVTMSEHRHVDITFSCPDFSGYQSMNLNNVRG